MNNTPRYIVVEQTDDCVLIKDVGPWDKHQTITNNPEHVVAELCSFLHGRRLEYIDSDGQRDQLLVKGGQFAGYAPVPPSTNQ